MLAYCSGGRSMYIHCLLERRSILVATVGLLHWLLKYICTAYQAVLVGIHVLVATVGVPFQLSEYMYWSSENCTAVLVGIHLLVATVGVPFQLSEYMCWSSENCVVLVGMHLLVATVGVPGQLSEYIKLLIVGEVYWLTEYIPEPDYWRNASPRPSRGRRLHITPTTRQTMRTWWLFADSEIWLTLGHKGPNASSFTTRTLLNPSGRCSRLAS